MAKRQVGRTGLMIDTLGLDDARVIWQPDYRTREKEPVIRVYRDGEPKVYELDP